MKFNEFYEYLYNNNNNDDLIKYNINNIHLNFNNLKFVIYLYS